MTNVEIIFNESVKLMNDKHISGSGVVGYSPDGKKMELPETIHTPATWRQLGFAVKKGQKAVSEFPIWKRGNEPVDEFDDIRDGKFDYELMLKQVSWFTKDQVRPTSSDAMILSYSLSNEPKERKQSLKQLLHKYFTEPQ